MTLTVLNVLSNIEVNQVLKPAVSRLRRLVVSLSPGRPRFDPTSEHVRFVVNKFSTGTAFSVSTSGFFFFFCSCQYRSTITASPSTRCSYRKDNPGEVRKPFQEAILGSSSVRKMCKPSVSWPFSVPSPDLEPCGKVQISSQLPCLQAGMGLRWLEHVFTCFLPPPVPSAALAPNYLPSLSPLSLSYGTNNWRPSRNATVEERGLFRLWRSCVVDSVSKLRAVIPCVSVSLFKHC